MFVLHLIFCIFICMYLGHFNWLPDKGVPNVILLNSFLFLFLFVYAFYILSFYLFISYVYFIVTVKSDTIMASDWSSLLRTTSYVDMPTW